MFATKAIRARLWSCQPVRNLSIASQIGSSIRGNGMIPVSMAVSGEIFSQKQSVLPFAGLTLQTPMSEKVSQAIRAPMIDRVNQEEEYRMDSVMRKRRTKMKKHKLRKRRKRQKAEKRKQSQG